MQVIEQTQLNACPDPQSDPTMAIESAETVSDVLRHIATLPPNQQEVLRLKFQGGLSYQQIADVTGLSRTNVGFLLHTAIAKLRRELR